MQKLILNMKLKNIYIYKPKIKKWPNRATNTMQKPTYFEIKCMF